MTLASNPVALITGGARRIGAEIARQLHAKGFNLLVHYHNSEAQALNLIQTLNSSRANSAVAVKADLSDTQAVIQLARQGMDQWGRVNLLINNASSFYPTPLGEVTPEIWDDIFASNLKAPFFLAQALAPALKASKGCIINIADIYAERPLGNHSVYCIAKAGNVMLTKTLARELAPEVRVNGIAPGAILWPESEDLGDDVKSSLLAKILLQQRGKPEDIARTAVFLAQESAYMTGQILTVDGGRSLTI